MVRLVAHSACNRAVRGSSPLTGPHRLTCDIPGHRRQLNPQWGFSCRFFWGRPAGWWSRVGWMVTSPGSSPGGCGRPGAGENPVDRGPRHPSQRCRPGSAVWLASRILRCGGTSRPCSRLLIRFNTPDRSMNRSPTSPDGQCRNHNMSTRHSGIPTTSSGPHRTSLDRACTAGTCQAEIFTQRRVMFGERDVKRKRGAGKPPMRNRRAAWTGSTAPARTGPVLPERNLRSFRSPDRRSVRACVQIGYPPRHRPPLPLPLPSEAIDLAAGTRGMRPAPREARLSPFTLVISWLSPGYVPAGWLVAPSRPSLMPHRQIPSYTAGS